MKARQKIITLTVVLALLVSTVSCSMARFTQKITADNIEITIRSDMTEMAEIKNDPSYITGYKWNGYGMNVTKINSVSATAFQLSGKTDEDLFNTVVNPDNNPGQIRKFGEISYIEMTDTHNQAQALSSVVYLLKEGYEYYFLEFFTTPENKEKYRSEYEKIVSSVKIINEPAKTVDAKIYDMIITMDGDAYEKSSGTWICSRYAVTVLNTNMSSANDSAEIFAKALIESGIKTADEQTPELKTTTGGVPYFEGMAKELYGTHFVKDINGTLYYIMLYTLVPTDEQLKLEFNSIIDGAHAA